MKSAPVINVFLRKSKRICVALKRGQVCFSDRQDKTERFNPNQTAISTTICTSYTYSKIVLNGKKFQQYMTLLHGLASKTIHLSMDAVVFFIEYAHCSHAAHTPFFP